MIRVKRLDKNAKLPTRAHSTDAGIDLYALEDYTLFPGEVTKIRTGISMSIPEGKVGLLWDRSSLGVKGIHRFAGVIDSSFTGEILVCLYNSRESLTPVDHYLGGESDIYIKGVDDKSYDNAFRINAGDKIAQILIQDVCLDEIIEVDELDETERGEGGFGSTGR